MEENRKNVLRQSVADLWNEACIEEQNLTNPFPIKRSCSAPDRIVTAEDEDIYALRCRVINKVVLDRREGRQPYKPSLARNPNFSRKRGSFSGSMDQKPVCPEKQFIRSASLTSKVFSHFGLHTLVQIYAF